MIFAVLRTRIQIDILNFNWNWAVAICSHMMPQYLGPLQNSLYPINRVIDFSIFNIGDFHQKASAVQSYVDLQLSLFCRPQMDFSKLLTNLPQI
jgi:hypothetical protein